MSDEALRARAEAALRESYEIEGELGRGGMAVVYRALDRRLRRRVAIKVLPPELAFRPEVKARFLREAQMAAQLSHPNIVPIFSVDEADGLVYFVMGLVEGEPLAARLHHEPRPPVAFVRRVLRDVCDALAYAHAQGTVHRDIKPDNILIETAGGRALVTDFGIARAALGDSRLTATGVAVGTPNYMSPEQALGEREVDGRADLYALGVVGYQMLAGELPFQATNTPTMLMKHISERPRPLTDSRPDLPANLVVAIERALRKGAAERWPDALAFKAALGEEAPVAAPVEPAASAPPLAPPPAAPAAAPPVPRVRAPHPPTAGVDRPRTPVPVPAAWPASIAPDVPAPPPSSPPRPGFGGGLGSGFGAHEHGATAIAQWREAQRRWRDELRDDRALRREARRDGRLEAALQGVDYTPEFRIRRIQRAGLGYLGTAAFLFVINMVTSPQVPWFLFAAGGMALSWVSRVSRLWVDGIPLRRIFQRQPVDAPAVAPAAPGGAGGTLPARGADPAAELQAAVSRLAPPDVVAGAHGEAVREAAEAQVTIGRVLAGLGAADRALLPDVAPTVTQLAERAGAMAQSLHQLDLDATPEAVTRLERRLAEARALPEGAPERARRLELLERQLATMLDLVTRREEVAAQLDHTRLVLQTMKLDLLRFRSGGLQSQLAEHPGATQEARAIAAEIERAVEVAREVRDLR